MKKMLLAFVLLGCCNMSAATKYAKLKSIPVSQVGLAYLEQFFNEDIITDITIEFYTLYLAQLRCTKRSVCKKLQALLAKKGLKIVVQKHITRRELYGSYYMEKKVKHKK